MTQVRNPKIMKALKQIGWFAALIPVLWACENYEIPPVIPQTGSASSDPKEGSLLVLNGDEPEALIPFSVTAAYFGITYSLQMHVVEVSFANSV